MKIEALVNGPIVITTDDGKKESICRCGLTETSPHCDNSHLKLRTGMAPLYLETEPVQTDLTEEQIDFLRNLGCPCDLQPIKKPEHSEAYKKFLQEGGTYRFGPDANGNIIEEYIPDDYEPFPYNIEGDNDNEGLDDFYYLDDDDVAHSCNCSCGGSCGCSE